MVDVKVGRDGKGKCKEELVSSHNFRREIPAVVDRIVELHDKEGRLNHVRPEPIPSREAVVDIIKRTLRILYPGYFDRLCVDEVNIRYYFGQAAVELFDILSEQIIYAIRHECMRLDLECTNCEERGQGIALALLREIPDIQKVLAKDVAAAFTGDPAAKNFDEIIFSYPGVYAISVYRIAHRLHKHGVPLLPRIMTEYAHGLTGIDIHPGVEIGESFFIDHGTGVVIGETTIIGNRVRIYQGVTIGALSLTKEKCEELRDKKRHPTIEDDVIIYSNATILGGKTVIGARSVIGGNVWITESVPPDTAIYLKKPEHVVKGHAGQGE